MTLKWSLHQPQTIKGEARWTNKIMEKRARASPADFYWCQVERCFFVEEENFNAVMIQVKEGGFSSSVLGTIAAVCDLGCVRLSTQPSGY
jgi:hypothetical protein